MNRVDIIYSGKPYSVGGRTVESLQQEVETAIVAAQPYWLHVNSGEGRLEDAYLLIMPGVPIVFIDVKANADPNDDDDVVSSLEDDTF